MPQQIEEFIIGPGQTSQGKSTDLGLQVPSNPVIYQARAYWQGRESLTEEKDGPEGVLNRQDMTQRRAS